MTIDGFHFQLIERGSDNTASRSYLCHWDDRFKLARLLLDLGANIRIEPEEPNCARVTADFDRARSKECHQLLPSFAKAAVAAAHQGYKEATS